MKYIKTYERIKKNTHMKGISIDDQELIRSLDFYFRKLGAIDFLADSYPGMDNFHLMIELNFPIKDLYKFQFLYDKKYIQANKVEGNSIIFMTNLNLERTKELLEDLKLRTSEYYQNAEKYNL